MMKILSEHFALIFSTAAAIAVLLLLLAVKLFHELRTDPTTKDAIRTELKFIRAIVAWFRPSAVPAAGQPDPLAETTKEPFKAVKDQREKKP